VEKTISCSLNVLEGAVGLIIRK